MGVQRRTYICIAVAILALVSTAAYQLSTDTSRSSVKTLKPKQLTMETPSRSIKIVKPPPAPQTPKVYTVSRPVREKHSKLVDYAVTRPVIENRSRVVRYTQMTEVVEQKSKTDPISGKQVTYTVLKHVPEQREKIETYSVCYMVTEQKQKTMDYETVRYETVEVSR